MFIIFFLIVNFPFIFLLIIDCSWVRPTENPPLIGFGSRLLLPTNEIVIYLKLEVYKGSSQPELLFANFSIVFLNLNSKC